MGRRSAKCSALVSTAIILGALLTSSWSRADEARSAIDLPPSETGADERPFGVAPWIVTGAGAAAVVAGVIPIVIGHDDIADAEQVCGASHTKCPQPDDATEAEKIIIADGEAGRTMVTAGWIVASAGGAAIIGGLVWQVFFNSPTPTETTGRVAAPAPRILPVVEARHRGLVLAGHF